MLRNKQGWFLYFSPGILFLGFLFWPLADDRFFFPEDEGMIQAKHGYLSAPATPRSDSLRRPNIVIITADDLGKTDISLYGSPYLQTPQLDALGQKGVTFTEAYVSSSICSPSRAGLLTGRYQQRFGYELQPHDRYPKNRMEYYAFQWFMVSGGWQVAEQGMRYPSQEAIDLQGLPVSEITLAEILKKQGYATGVMGKWHLGTHSPFLPNERGFDFHYGFYEAFTLYADTTDPDIVNHHHHEFTDRFIWGKGREGSCAIRRNDSIIEEKEYLTFAIAREAKQFIAQHHEEPFFLYVPFNAPHTPFQAPKEYVDRFAHVPDPNKRIYYAMIAALDDAVGQIMEQLRTLGLEKNTLVMFSSDNGGATYTGATDNAPLKGGKFSNFEGGTNVPCMAYWPGKLPAGTFFSRPIILQDFFMTAAAMAGAELPVDRVYDGVNLYPYVNGFYPEDPHSVVCWRSGYNKSVRKGDWKLILNTMTHSTLLYHLGIDKSEKQNVAAQNPEVVEELKQELVEWEKGMMSPKWPRIMDYKFVIDGEEFVFAI